MKLKRLIAVLIVITLCTTLFAFGSKEKPSEKEPDVILQLSEDGRSIIGEIPMGYENDGDHCLDGYPLIYKLSKNEKGIETREKYRVNPDGSLLSMEEAGASLDTISFPIIIGGNIIIPAEADVFLPEYITVPYEYDVIIMEGNKTFEIIDGVLYDKTKDELVFIFTNGQNPTTETVSFNFANMQTLIVPEGIKSIGKACLLAAPDNAQLSQLEIMVLPDSLEYIDPEAFINGKPSAIFTKDNKNLNIVDGMILSEDGKLLISVITPDDNGEYQNVRAYVDKIPDGVEVIGPFALSYVWTENGENFIPPSVRKIDKYSFWYTYIFPTLVIPESVEEIGYRSFQGAWIPEIRMFCSKATIDPDAFEDAEAIIIKQ